MAVLKPTITNISNFDSTLDYVLNFNIDSSSDQCFGNRIIIYNNSTNTVIYDNIVTSFLISHDIPANTLQNGVIYKITVAYFNLSGVYSSFSDGTIFRCLDTPIVSLSNLITNQIVASNNYSPIGSYSQAQSIAINTYEFYLYDSNGILLQSSPTLFYSPSNVIQYQFTNFINNTKYGIALHTMSAMGIDVDTDIVYFNTQYIAPTFAGTVLLENLPDIGGIQLTSNAIQIIAKTGSGTISFTGNSIDLTNGMIYFGNTEGMTIFSDFTIDLFNSDFTLDLPFLTLLSPQGKIELCWKSWNKCINATKTTSNGTCSYNIFGQEVDLTTINKLYIFFQQIGNYLNLEYEISS